MIIDYGLNNKNSKKPSEFLKVIQQKSLILFFLNLLNQSFFRFNY